MSSNSSFLLVICVVAAASAAAGIPRVRSESPVLYTVTNNANNTAGGSRFDKEIGAKFAKQTMYAATRYAWMVFNQADDPTARKNITKISLSVDDIKNDAAASTAAETKNETIHLNANYVAGYTLNLRRQFNGIIYQEIAAIWQWDARGQAPAGLLTGIAHYVRLQARYGTTEKVRPGEGDRWDQGNGVTARFLGYCEKLNRDFVGELNKKMRHGYTDGFFLDLLGFPVDHLWANYKEKYHTTTN